MLPLILGLGCLVISFKCEVQIVNPGVGAEIWYNTTLYLGVNFTLFKFNYCYFLESLGHVPTNRFTVNENQKDDVIYGISRPEYKRQNLQK